MRITDKEYNRAYYLKNKARINAQNIEWAKQNPEKMNEYKRNWEIANKEVLAIRRSNSESRKEYQKQYGKTNRKAITAKQQKRKQEDMVFKLRINLRNRLNRAIKNSYKSGSAIRDLGSSVQELKHYLEKLFQPGMTWLNYGKGNDKWNVDHIIPLTKFDLKNPKEIKKACNFKNLRPMWHIDNIKKGNR